MCDLLGVERSEVRAKSGKLLLVEHGFDAGKDDVLFQANVIVKKLAEVRDLGFCEAVFGQRGGQVLKGCADLGMVGKHAHDGRLLIKASVAGQGRQEDVLLFAEVRAAADLPEMQKRFGRVAEPDWTTGAGLLGRAGDLQGLHQGMVVMFAQRMKAGMTFHGGTTTERIRGYLRSAGNEEEIAIAFLVTLT